MEQIKPKKFEGKVTQLIALDKELWNTFKSVREPYGTINDLFEDCIRVLMGQKPKHQVLVDRLNQVLPILK